VAGVLSRRQRESYERDGVLFPVRVLSDEEVAASRAALEALAAGPGEGPRRRFDALHRFVGWAYRLATHEAVLGAVEDLLGPDLLVDGTLVFYKPPRDAAFVPWHQDSVYSGWHLTPSTSAWIALSASHPANGCMRVLPGSHRQGLVEHANEPAARNLLRRGERVAAAVDESRAVDVTLRPGEMSLHHSTIIHGSNPNASDEPRVGFIVRFVTSRTPDPGRPLLRVRGEGDCRHLTLADPPPAADDARALAAWLDFSRGK
jgi:ectoine hydroxylase-related dioxygenase (phytanoyl-CoA dioxygenase family)